MAELGKAPATVNACGMCCLDPATVMERLVGREAGLVDPNHHPV